MTGRLERLTMLASIIRLQRPLIAIILTCLLVYLAMEGHDAAITAAITAFSLLIGHLFGERAALKVPGNNPDDGQASVTRIVTDTSIGSSTHHTREDVGTGVLPGTVPTSPPP